jgi:hypothetical protein
MDGDRQSFAFVRTHSWLIVVLLVFALRLPFLHQAIQGDDPYYLYGAEHAQIDPLHPHSTRYLFQGDLVDMRGLPHPPLNAWILAAPLAVLGRVSEAPFHFLYMLWSLIAALAMWSLARRFCDQPFIATVLFLAVPAFVVNGNSLEADLPFLAMWMAAMALFVKAVDEDSGAMLTGSSMFAVLAGLAAYQAILLTPVLAAYLFEKRRARKFAWVVILAAPAALAAWQLFEWASTGVLPAAMLAGYMKSYSLEAAANKLRSAAALIGHAGWIVCPLIVFFLRGAQSGAMLRWIAAGAGGGCALIYDANPIFVLAVAGGVFLLTTCVHRDLRRDFISLWILIFFSGAAVVFFAGSARYLLPIAAPVAILAVRLCPRPVLIAGFALQMALSLGLAIVNFEHWDAYRQFAESLREDATAHRVWINAEWGLRWYLEQEGALPMPRDQVVERGDVVVTSTLALPLAVNAPLAPISETEIRPAIPLRIISLDRRSAYSAVSERGLLPFEISTAPIDRVRAEVVVERNAQLIWISPGDPQAAVQIISGLSSDGWMGDKATVLLKRPDHLLPLRLEMSIPALAPARHVQMLVNGQLVAEETFAKAGEYVISVPPDASLKGAALTVTLTVDTTFSVPKDRRRLGIVITGIGFR